ncbi:hypothetical protein ACFPOI_23335 [Nonomuraea angiospora]|uniref:DUF998 domain-containing protein n=1 Tax=Nonomuraea angiospora TaxID=46172 RepID=A0ABR9MM97_9ACTN|nr:hypothetical protein [Nonomuraea angiospora]MBE1593608.1 hypothetical protein [Nonomuraea angiospora]
MITWTGRWAVWAAASWTLLYVASKIHFALAERIGVTGGPRVAPETYLEYGPGEIARAQWANAAAGLLVAAVVLASLIPFRRPLPRRTMAALLWSCAAMAAAGAIGMTAGALFAERGGALFGGYCAVWAVLLCLASLSFHRRRPSIMKQLSR